MLVCLWGTPRCRWTDGSAAAATHLTNQHPVTVVPGCALVFPPDDGPGTALPSRTVFEGYSCCLVPHHSASCLRVGLCHEHDHETEMLLMRLRDVLNLLGARSTVTCDKTFWGATP